MTIIRKFERRGAQFPSLIRHNRVSFRFTGRIAKLTFKLGPPQLTEADRNIIAAGRARVRN